MHEGSTEELHMLHPRRYGELGAATMQQLKAQEQQRRAFDKTQATSFMFRGPRVAKVSCKKCSAHLMMAHVGEQGQELKWGGEPAATFIPCDDLGGLSLGAAAPRGGAEGGDAEEEEAMETSRSSTDWFGRFPCSVVLAACPSCGSTVGARLQAFQPPCPAFPWTRMVFGSVVLSLPRVSLTQPRVPMLLPLQDPLDALDQIALNFMSTRGIWGMAANFFIPGSQRAVGRGWGYTTAVWGSGDGEEPPRMRPDSRVRVGSISRLLTAIALLQLVDAAKLDLDESLLSILERTGTQTAGDPSAEDDSGGGACDGASSASSSESLAPSEPDAPAPNPLIALVADSSGASSTSRRLRATVRQLLQHINGGSSGPDAEALSNGTSCSAHSLLCHLIETLSADGRSYEQYVQEEVLAWCRGVPGSGRAEQTCAPRIEGWLQPSSSGMGSYRSEMGGYYNNKSRAWQLEPAHERLTTPNDVDAAAGGFLLSTREMVQVARATARASANGNTTQVLQPSAAPRVDGRPLLSDESLCILHGSKDGGSLGWTVDKTGENRFQLSGVGGHACLLMSSERQPGVCLAVAMNTCSKFEDVAELEAFAMECLPAVAELAKNGWD